jgi:lipoprotein-anchoring transpeptidase ErfK/SrfK
MRISILALAVVNAGVSALPASAEQIKFSPDTFQIYGGLDNSPTKQMRSQYRGMQTVDFMSELPPGSIIVKTYARKLYYILPGGKAIEYGVGVGREGFTWSGTDKVVRKTEWPDWHPPKIMINREALKGHYIPAYMPGGPDNPLGARALYIGDTEYRIHGTSQPRSIGLAVSSGCIRLLNEEVIDLYNRVQIGALVVVE